MTLTGEEMNRKIEENQIYEKINLDLKTYVTICEKKIRDKMPPVNFSETLETIKERICKEKMDADTVVAEFKQKTAGLWLQVCIIFKTFEKRSCSLIYVAKLNFIDKTRN